MTQRKLGERYDCGKLRPEAETTISPALLKRCMDTVELRASEQRLASEAGRLMLMKQLSPRLAWAAMRVAEVVGRYDWLNGRRRSSASPSYEIGRGGDSGLDIDEVTATKIKTEHADLMDVIPDDPRDCREIVIGFAVEDHHVPWWWREHLQRVLEGIATHFERAERAGKKKTRIGRRHISDLPSVALDEAPLVPEPSKIRAWRAPDEEIADETVE